MTGGRRKTDRRERLILIGEVEVIPLLLLCFCCFGTVRGGFRERTKVPESSV